MDYFDQVVNRLDTYSLKWNVEADELPMWIADMDFKVAPPILEALHDRVDHGVFGYTVVPDEWRIAIANFWQRHHHLTIDPNSLIFIKGIVPAIGTIIRTVTSQNDNVIVMTPGYNMFYQTIENANRKILECELVYQDYKYSIDFNLLEEQMQRADSKLLLLCNPHNPLGIIWDGQTLERIGKLAAKYNVLVVSDEIHGDIVTGNHHYIPYVAVDDSFRANSITCIAPSKTFNLAGLQTAAIFTDNEQLKKLLETALESDDVSRPNTFAITAAISAFNDCDAWLDNFNRYLTQNKQIVNQYIIENIPQIKPVAGPATYLEWLDCSAITANSEQLAIFIREYSGLYLSHGTQFKGNGQGFLRMNIACNTEQLIEGLERLKEAVSNYQEIK